nr:MAG TPA: hypothetical protein [Caudoviricetes sp.]
MGYVIFLVIFIKEKVGKPAYGRKNIRNFFE